jgi:charged multivesicular body protein 2A
MAQAMKGVTKALVGMNKKINLPGMQKIMAEFMRENEKADMTQEMIGDTLDDAMEEEGTEAEENAIVGQVLDELGINLSEGAPIAPTGNMKVAAAAAPEEEKQAGLCLILNTLRFTLF